MKFHPYSEIFPLIEGAALDELVADIKTNGLREKIWTYDGKILDGRNRFAACQKAKVKPTYRKYSGKDPLAFVISLNVHRRHLNESQRASAAAKIAILGHGGDRKTDQAANLPTQSEAAKALNVSERSVRSARKVHEKGSQALRRALDDGDVPVSRAVAVVGLPKSEQLAAATAPKKPSVEDDDWAPEKPDMDALDEESDRNYRESQDRVIQSDDRLAAMDIELKRQAIEIASLMASRNGFMGAKNEVLDLLKKEQRKVTRLEKELKKAQGENENLRERVAIMEAA